MKQESHRRLGRHLMDQLPRQPKRRHSKAFLIGCVEPDRNPLSYLKGSLRSKWFYGHNYQNADRWIERTIRHLQQRAHWNLLDYYRLGKLIHYTSDAFTYVHNNCFCEPIHAHRAYESELQELFLQRLQDARARREARRRDLAEAFRAVHAQYLEAVADVHRDCQYILEMTERVFCQLLPEAAAVPSCPARFSPA